MSGGYIIHVFRAKSRVGTSLGDPVLVCEPRQMGQGGAGHFAYKALNIRNTNVMQSVLIA